jgi:DNA-binding GntR family transcriptional regulator
VAADRATTDDIAALKGIVRRQEELRDASDFDRFYVLDDEFHAALCGISGHGVAWALAQRANGHLNRVRRLSLPQPRYVTEMVAEHQLVLDAVARRDPDGAEAALRHHLRMVLSGLDAIRNEHPDYFEDT